MTAVDATDAVATEPPWHAVRVHWPDGTSHDDEIRGWDRQHAIDAAQWNWGTANPYGACERIEYLGVSEAPVTAEPAEEWTAAGAETNDEAEAGA